MAEEEKKTKNHPSATKKVAVGLIIGIVLGILIGYYAFQKAPATVTNQEVKGYTCKLDPQTMFGRACEQTPDCYGRTEICNVYQKKCVSSAKVDQTLMGNIRSPITKTECETVGGTWSVLP